MFKFNDVLKAINCATGQEIDRPQIVSACLGDTPVSLVFVENILIVHNGQVVYPTACFDNGVQAFFDAHKALKEASNQKKVAKNNLKKFYGEVGPKKIRFELSKLKVGDTVDFRDEKQRKVSKIDYSIEVGGCPLTLSFSCGTVMTFTKDGNYFTSGTSPYDILYIIKA